MQQIMPAISSLLCRSLLVADVLLPPFSPVQCVELLDRGKSIGRLVLFRSSIYPQRAEIAPTVVLACFGVGEIDSSVRWPDVFLY